MTDENSHREEEHDKELHAFIDENGDVWFRDAEGKLQKHEEESTGDPELDALWAMPADQLEDIVDNRNHPLNEKARWVVNEASRPYLEALELVGKSWTNVLGPIVLDTLNFAASGIFEPVIKQFGRTFSRGFIGWIPELLQHSSVGLIGRDLVEQIVESEAHKGSSQQVVQEPLPEIDEALPTAADEFSDLVDEHADELPAPSPAVIKSFGVNVLRFMEEGLEEQARTRAENRQAAIESTKWAKKANTKGNWTIVLAALTLIATVIGACASLFGWSL